MSGTIELDYPPYYNSVQDYDDLLSVRDIEQDLWLNDDLAAGWNDAAKNDITAGGVDDVRLDPFDVQAFMAPPALGSDMHVVTAQAHFTALPCVDARVEAVPSAASRKRKVRSAPSTTTGAQGGALSKEEVVHKLSLGDIVLVENDDIAGAMAKGGNKSNSGNNTVPGNLSKAKQPTQSLYVWRRDDGLNNYSITEYYETVFKALEQWVAMNIPGERRGEDGERHDFMKWSWFKLESEEERDRMYQAILSNKKERTQNKRRKAMDTTDGEELTKEDVNEFGKMEVNQVGKMLGEMGIVRDGKRKGRVYLDFRFSTHQWNKQGWRLTKARNLPRPDIKPWKWAVQPALPCV